MFEYIQSMLKELPTCVMVSIPMKLQIDSLDVAVEYHELDIVEYKDADGNVLMRHTVLGDF